MGADEPVRAVVVGDVAAALQRDVHVRRAGHYDRCPILLEEIPGPDPDVEVNSLLLEPVAYRSGVGPAMPGVDTNLGA